MSFSGGLRLTDLNDYITPGQECIKPVKVNKTNNGPTDSTIKVDTNNNYYEVSKDGEQTKLEAAQITLNDCLACSGCVTTAETVLITMQSHKDLLSAIAQKGTKYDLIVVTVAPQSRASFALKYSMPMGEVAQRITGFLKQDLGSVDYVLDTAFVRDLTLIEGAREFTSRFRERNSLPVLASWCPGWVCYAEKTHPHILPYMSTTRSPQQTAGVLVKDYMANKLGIAPDRIFHATIMMCYDKKLEASRDDFYSDIYKTRDVDCVITTGELDRLIAESPVGKFAEASLSPLDKFFKADDTGLYSAPGSSAGGGLEFTMSYSAKLMFEIDISPAQIASAIRSEAPHRLIQVKDMRGQSDHREITLLDPATSRPLLKFATVYGFRHLQNLVRKVKSGRAAYHYVEVAACPTACSNGGGQLKPQEESPAAKKEWVTLTEKVYVEGQGAAQSPLENPAITELAAEWFGPMGLDAPKAKELLHTGFRGVETKVNPLGVSW